MMSLLFIFVKGIHLSKLGAQKYFFYEKFQIFRKRWNMKLLSKIRFRRFMRLLSILILNLAKKKKLAGQKIEML